MTYGTMEKIETVTVGASGAASIEFLNIPATYDDLLIKVSIRNNNTGLRVRLNNDANANYSWRRLNGNGTAAFSDSNATYGSPYNTFLYFSMQNSTTDTASTFSNGEMYLPNYRSSSAKSAQLDSVAENNATSAFMAMQSGLWTGTAAVTSITLSPDVSSSPSIVQHSTATLYGITRVPAGAKATGGVIYDDASYWYHVFTSTGTFAPSTSLSCDVLVVAGGGGGGRTVGGGGGAGGLLFHGSQSLTAQNYTVTVGAGGAGSTSFTNAGTSGSNSQFASLTASVGGGGGGPGDSAGAALTGGSGGGRGAAGASSGAGASGTSGQGNSGGSGNQSWQAGGGGGGAGAAGANGAVNAAGNGGNGVSTYSSWGLATNTGENVSGTVWYAGGGGAGSNANAAGAPVAGSGGLGGGSAGRKFASEGVPSNALAFTGGGGGGSGGNGDLSNGASGGSGVVIVRYAK